MIECAKLRASRVFVSYVPHVPLCITCVLSFHVHVSLHAVCLCFVRAFICFMCLTCLQLFTCLTHLHFLRALRAFIFLGTLLAFVFYVPSCFTYLHFSYVYSVKLRQTNELTSKAAVQRCSEEKVFWKYAANLQENTHAEVSFQ